MAGMAWQTTHVAGTYKMPVPINAIKTFQQPLVGQKQKDQTCSLVKKHASHYTKTCPRLSPFSFSVTNKWCQIQSWEAHRRARRDRFLLSTRKLNRICFYSRQGPHTPFFLAVFNASGSFFFCETTVQEKWSWCIKDCKEKWSMGPLARIKTYSV